jgi:hypothetical protein
MCYISAMTCSRYPHLLRAMHSTNNCHQNCLIFSSLMLMLMKNGKYASRKESLSSGWYQLVFMIVQNTIFFEETQHSPKKEKYIKKSIITRLFWPYYAFKQNMKLKNQLTLKIFVQDTIPFSWPWLCCFYYSLQNASSTQFITSHQIPASIK